jgi:sugar lactone lactonase YvrE
MRMRAAHRGCFLLTAVGLLAVAAAASADPAKVLIQGERIYPESVTSTSNGTLIIGSIGTGIVFRSMGGATGVPWIPAGTNGLLSVFGVLADEKSQTLWVCSSEATNGSFLAAPGQSSASLMAFNLRTGAPKSKFPFPETHKSLCNDIAVGRDGTVYATDTRNGRILILKKGASALELWLQNDMLQGGLDGIAFGNNATLYVNTIETGHLLRIEVLADGSAGTITPIQTSRPLEHPDGMRPVAPNQFLLIEGAGRVDLLTVTGDSANVETLKDGFVTPSGVTAVGNTAWVVEGKFAYRTNPKFKDQDPGAFYATAVSWRNR